MRDRREDAGQYYPGGRVVPKTPTGQGGGGTSDYDQLANKPKINNHELTGNKTAEQLGLATPSDIPDVVGKLPLRALPPYLHFLSFDDTYPADAAWLYAQLGPSDMGQCSAVRRGGKLWRNYDWTFDDAAEFVVRMSGNASRYASVGVASVGSRLTENDVMSAVNSRYYKCLPGMTLDGINEKGVVCEINVDGGPKTGWHGTGANALHILAAVRWCLDHGETAQQAAEWIADHIIQPQGEMNFHFMVADAEKTYIVENGDAYDVADGTKVITNFPLYSPAETYPGTERYQLLSGGADIKSVWFTNAYQPGNTWDSDFDSESQHAAAIEQWAEQGTDKEAHRGKTTSSGKALWQSVHTTEYDFAAKTMKVAVQEVDDWYTFAVGQANVDLSPIEAQIAALQSSKLDKTYVVPADPDAADGKAAEAKTARHIEDRSVYGESMTDEWEWTPALPSGVYLFHYPNTPAAIYPDQWSMKILGDSDPNVAGMSDPKGNSESTVLSWAANEWYGGYPIEARRKTALVPKQNQQLAAVATDDASKPTNGDILKYDADNDRFVKAEKSSTSSDPANADYRDPKDNTCHKTEFTEWTSDDAPAAFTEPILYGNEWFTRTSDSSEMWIGAGTENSTSVKFYEESSPRSFTATRSAVCTKDMPFSTFDVVSALVNGVKSLLGSVASGYSTFAEWIASKRDHGDFAVASGEKSTALFSSWTFSDGQEHAQLVWNGTSWHDDVSGHWVCDPVGRGPVTDPDATYAEVRDGTPGGELLYTASRTITRYVDGPDTLVGAKYADAIKAKTSLLETDGKASDTFATDLMGKQVAKAAIVKECLYDEYTVPTTGDDAYNLHANASNLLVFNSSQTSYTFDLSAHLPQKVNGKLMDFFIELNTDAPVTVSTNAADTAKIRGDSPSVSEAGNYWITFSTKADGTIYIRNIKMEAPQS